MAFYRAKYTLEGHAKSPMTYLKENDEVELLIKGKSKRIVIAWTGRYRGEVVYGTDSMGVILARELERVV